MRDRAMIYDVDDAVWLDATSPGASRATWLKRSARKSQWLATCADAVIAGNELLAEHLSAFSTTVHIVPSVVDTSKVVRKQHTDKETLVLGWLGSPSSAGYLHRVRPALERLARMLPAVQLQLVVVGGSAPPVLGVDVRQQPWSEAAETMALRRMDIGLMPLPDDAWARGKCAYKALMYMAAGIPVIADDVGVVARVVGGAGIIADGTPGWIDAASSLVSDATLRQRLGGYGRERVERHYSVSRWTPEIARIIRLV